MGETDTDPDDTSDGSCSAQDGDIRIEYHPNSGRNPKTYEFEAFTQEALHSTPTDFEPWAPFKTREDFEFAALMQDAGMSKAQVNKLIGLFHRCVEGGKGSFMLSSYDEMHDILTLASEQLPKVCLQIHLCTLHIT